MKTKETIHTNKDQRAIEKYADRIATGRRQRIALPRRLLQAVGERVEEKYWGTFTWFGFGGTAHVMRDKIEKMTPKEVKA